MILSLRTATGAHVGIVEEGLDTRLPMTTPHPPFRPATPNFPEADGGLVAAPKGNWGPRGKHSVKSYPLSVLVIDETTRGGGRLSAQVPCPTAAGFDNQDIYLCH